MEEVWPEDDPEFTALDKFQKRINNFFEEHKTLRKVSNFLVTHVAPELQGGISKRKYSLVL